MFAGDFLRKLKKLNSRLTVLYGPRFSGIYYKTSKGLEHVCAIDNNYVPEYPETDEKGHRLKSGWRYAVRALLTEKYITRHDIMRVFPTYFDSRGIDHMLEIEFNALHRPSLGQQISDRMAHRALTGEGGLTADDIYELGGKVRKESPLTNDEIEEQNKLLYNLKQEGVVKVDLKEITD